MADRRDSAFLSASAGARPWVFVAAAAIGAFDIGSYWYLKRESVDFVVARRESEAPPCRIGVPVSWQGQAPGALFGWFRPGTAGTWSDGPVAALAARLPGRPAGDLLLVARAGAFVDPGKRPSREVDVFVNRRPVAVWRFDRDQPVERTARIARALVADDGLVRVDFRFREAGDARDFGDDRMAPRLGMRLLDWRLELQSP